MLGRDTLSMHSVYDLACSLPLSLGDQDKVTDPCREWRSILSPNRDTNCSQNETTRQDNRIAPLGTHLTDKKSKFWNDANTVGGWFRFARSFSLRSDDLTF